MGAFENALSEEPKHVIIDLLGKALDENRALKKQLAQADQTAYDRSEKLFVVALDFDGTLVDRGNWPGFGPDLESRAWLLELQRLGAKFVLWTMRDGPELQAAADYCRNLLDIELFGINENPTQHGWTRSPKAHYTVLVDDRGIGVPLRKGVTDHLVVDWGRVGPLLIDFFYAWVKEEPAR